MKKLQTVLSVIMVTIPIGFGLILVAVQQSELSMKVFLGGIGLCLLLLSAWEYRRTQRKIDEEERKQVADGKNRHNELISELRGIREDLGKQK